MECDLAGAKIAYRAYLKSREGKGPEPTIDGFTPKQQFFLACGIGLPGKQIEGDMNGLRIGTPELVRWGMTEAHMPKLATLIAEGLRSNDPESVAPRTSAFRQQFSELHYIRQ